MFKNHETEEQYNRIMDLCVQKGISKYELSKGIGKTTSLFSDVVSGRVGISGTVLIKCAEFLDVSVEYLKNGTKKENSPIGEILTEGEQMLIDIFRKIPEDKQDLVLNMIKLALTK